MSGFQSCVLLENSNECGANITQRLTFVLGTNDHDEP